MARTPNRIHVFNFGNFYMPSYQDIYEDTYNELDLDAGTLHSWEGQLDPTYTDPETTQYKWPLI